MRVVIVGAGLVGSTLAIKLSGDGHDVSLVDSDGAALHGVSEMADIQGIEGNGATPPVLRRAGIEAADLVLAATNSDEVNLVVGLLASSLFRIPRIVLRLRSTGHNETFDLINREGSVDHVSVDPDEVAVDRIAALLEVPDAVDVLSFMEGQLLVAGFRIRSPSDFVGLRVSDMNLLFAATPTLALAIHRRDDWIIPHGGEVLEEKDLVYFAIPRAQLHDVLSLVGVREDRRRGVMIGGASRIGRELARRLARSDVKTVLVERDPDRARAASEELGKALVIRGAVTDPDLLAEEEIDRISTFVAVTDDHETNLVAGLLAKRLGAGRAVVLVDNPALVNLVGEIGIDAIISPRVLAIGLILQYVLGSGVRSAAQLLEDRIEIIEAEVEKKSRLARATLSELKLPRGVLVAALKRGEKLLVPRGSDRAEPGDRVLLITTTENEPKLAEFLSD